jgi:hypothetical protein
MISFSWSTHFELNPVGGRTVGQNVIDNHTQFSNRNSPARRLGQSAAETQQPQAHHMGGFAMKSFELGPAAANPLSLGLRCRSNTRLPAITRKWPWRLRGEISAIPAYAAAWIIHIFGVTGKSVGWVKAQREPSNPMPTK